MAEVLIPLTSCPNMSERQLVGLVCIYLTSHLLGATGSNPTPRACFSRSRHSISEFHIHSFPCPYILFSRREEETLGSGNKSSDDAQPAGPYRHNTVLQKTKQNRNGRLPETKPTGSFTTILQRASCPNWCRRLTEAPRTKPRRKNQRLARSSPYHRGAAQGKRRGQSFLERK